MANFVGFLTWDDVMKHVREGKDTFYKAPFDRSPRRVLCKPAKTKKTIRVDPLSNEAGKVHRRQRPPRPVLSKGILIMPSKSAPFKAVAYTARRGKTYHPSCQGKAQSYGYKFTPTETQHSRWPRGAECPVCGGKTAKAKTLEYGYPRASFRAETD